MEKKTVFSRQSTGLVKNVSLLDAIALNLGDMSPGASIALFGFTMVLLPSISGLNLVYCSIIAFVMFVPQVVVYSMLLRRLPRTGADYVWVTRQFGGFFGNTISFAGTTFAFFGFTAIIALSLIFTVGSVGVLEGNLSFLNLAVPGSDPPLQFVFAAVVLTAIVGINLARPKFAYRLQSILIMLGIVLMLAAVVVLLAAGRSGVVSYFNSLGIANTTYASVASSYTGGSFNFGNTIVLLPFLAIYAYPFLNASSIVGSELKGKNTVKWSMSVSFLIAFVLMTGGLATLYYVAGQPFINAAFANSNLVFNYSINFWSLAMGVSSPAVSWALGIGWIIWNILTLNVLVIGASRYILAQGFDRYLPEKLSSVNERTGSPVYALLLQLAVVLALVAGVAWFYGTLSSISIEDLTAMIFFLSVGVASVMYARKNEKGRPRSIMMIFGVLNAVVFAFIVYEILAYPAVWGGNALGYGYVIGSFVTAALVWMVSKEYHKRKGIDISLVFKEIPPE